jgi:hypothetical protein
MVSPLSSRNRIRKPGAQGYTQRLSDGGLRPGLLDDRQIGISVLPESEEILVNGG